MTIEAWVSCFDPACLRRNLEALALVDSILARRLDELPYARPNIRPTLLASGLPSAEVAWRMTFRPLHRTDNPILEARQWLETCLPLPSTLLLAGLGLGYRLEAVLTSPKAPQRCLVFEPDDFWIYLTLARTDLSSALRERRVRFLDADLLLDEADNLPANTAIAVHPVLEPFVRWEVDALRARLSSHSAGLSPLGGSQEGAEGTARAARLPWRIFLAEGGLFVDELARELRARGDEILSLPYSRLSGGDLAARLTRGHVDLVLSVNLVEGLAELCAHAQVPYAVWEIDPRLWVPPPPSAHALPGTFIFTWREANLRRYREAGFPHVYHLPLAACPAVRHPLDLEPDLRASLATPLSFVGVSLVGDGSHERAKAELALRDRLESASTPGEKARWVKALRILRDAIQAQHQDLMRPHLPERLETGWASLGLEPLLEVEGRRMDLRIVYSRAFGCLRRRLVLSTLAELGVDVYGDQGWAEGMDPRVRYRGPADHGEALTRVYNATAVNLDVGRLYQLDIVNMRVFDVLACGGFVLAEASQGLETLFQVGREVVVWRNLAELRALAAHYLHHPEERRAIAEAGRARVLQSHTFAHRLETILSAVLPSRDHHARTAAAPREGD